jgi:hypothetical protein
LVPVILEQVVDQVRVRGRFVAGTSGNVNGRPGRAVRAARIDAIVSAWAGGARLTGAELGLLRHAAELSLSRPKTHEDRVRVFNSIRSALKQCRLVGCKRNAAGPSLREYLTSEAAKANEGVSMP